MKHIFKVAAVVLAAMTADSCSNNKFKVEGQIANAGDSVLYFENVGLEGIEVLDSVTLGGDGSFAFSGDPAEALDTCFARAEAQPLDRLRPEAAARTIVRVALQKRRVKPYYAIGFSYKFLVLLDSLLPCRLVRWLLFQLYGK